MTSFRFKNVAHETVSATLILWISKMETPEDGNLTWIGRHRLDEGPDEHEEKHVEDREQDDNSPIV